MQLATRDEALPEIVEVGPDTFHAPVRRWPWRSLSFLLFVLVPFAVAVWYYGWVATDQYVAEARFVVRTIVTESPEVESGGDGATGLAALSAASLNQDAYVVTSFIHSHEIIDRISRTIPIREIYGRESIDPISRLGNTASREELLDYWDDMITTYVDGPSGIVTINVHAFEPEEARALAQAIIDESELLVNQLSERARRDVVARATVEAEISEEKYLATLERINAYQNESGILAPEQQARSVGELMTGLMAQQLEAEARLSVLRQGGSSQSPIYTQLERTNESLRAQIASLQTELTGDATGAAGEGGAQSREIAAALVEFSRLETDRILHENLYSLAQQALQFARSRAARQGVYVATFSAPFVPDAAEFPKRVQTPVVILLGLVVLWTIGLLVIASVEDHRQ